jgi:RND family efflux transporter MFP subunit
MNDPNTGAAAHLRAFRRMALVVLAVAVLVTAWGVFARLKAQAALRADAAHMADVTVAVVRPTVVSGAGQLVLPGEVQALMEAAVYARTSGYVRRRFVDIGQSVHAGQVLAEIDTPEVDAQLRQAEADQASAASAEQLARETAARWQSLFARGVVSRQDVDDHAADATAKRAALEAAQANVARLRELTAFKRVLAPFAGIVTARGAEVGALINAGSGAELFHVAATRRLRVRVNVPEADAAGVRMGASARLSVRDRPGQSYPASIARSAHAIDPATRTLLVELEFDNSSGELLPGAFAEVRLDVAGGSGILRLPAAALQFRGDGVQVATVGAGGRVVFHHVALGRDLGQDVEVLSGINADEQVVVDPSDSLMEGDRVHVQVAVPRERR